MAGPSSQPSCHSTVLCPCVATYGDSGHTKLQDTSDVVDREQFHLILIALNKLKQPMWLVAKALDQVGKDCVFFIKWPTLIERHPHGNFHIDN